MEPTVGKAAVLSLHVWAGITGALVVATIWLQQKELRMAAIWIRQYPQNRAEQIADTMLKKAQEKQMKRIADAMAQLYGTEKGPPATDNGRPCDS